MRKSEMYRPVPTKGLTKGGLQMIMFDAVQECRGEYCPIYVDCKYMKSGTCTVEMNYLKALLDSMTQMIGNDMDQGVLNKITLHLLPLFHQLIRFQIYAYSVSDVCFTTNNGTIRAHPIFKEIRDTLRSIENTQASLGTDGEYIRALGALGSGLRGRKAVEAAMKKGEVGFRDRWQTENFDSDVFPEGKSEHPKRVSGGGE